MRVYDASPTITKLFDCDKGIQLLLGPIGGGKTVGILMKILTLAHLQEPNANGLRKTRWGVVRNTRPQLKDSVLKTVFDWLPPDGKRVRWIEGETTLELNLPLPDGTTVHCEMLFRALDDERDARRLLSVEYTGVWFSEFREIPFALLTDALSRTGRYPSKADGGCTWAGLLGESNFPILGSDWHQFMEEKLPENAIVLKQPSALSPFAENLQNLPADYYTRLMATASADWIKAHITCEYPDRLDGRAVYATSYDSSRHLSTKPLRILHGHTVLIGVDQGRNPAAVAAQQVARGGLQVLREVHGANMGMERFCDEILRPMVVRDFAGFSVIVLIDPAGFTRNDTNEVTPAMVLESRGFVVVKAPSNDLEQRIGAVEHFLRLSDGLLLDPSCRHLADGMGNSYRYRARKDGELEDKPEKKHPVSDLQDALQYVALTVRGPLFSRVLARAKRMLHRPTNTGRAAPPASRGWT